MRTRKAAIGAFLATILVGTGAPAASAAVAAIPAPPQGFKLTWSTDFSGAKSGVDSAVWRYDTGPGSSFGTGEVETMTKKKANVFRDGQGDLTIKAIHQGDNPVGGWTSGRIETRAGDFKAPEGGVLLVKARIKQPEVTAALGAGYWPAFWMLGSTLRTGTTWPKSGEVDILEDVNGRSSVWGTLHCGESPGGPCKEQTGLSSGERPCQGCQTAYHTYAVQIDRSKQPEQIRWYRDGVNYYTVKSTQVPAATWGNAVHHGFFIILDLAIGGSFPNAFGRGPTAATVSGRSMKVDYVAVYNKAP